MFDKYWRLVAQKAEVAAGAIFVSGFLLFGFALFLNLHSVQFDGRFKEGTLYGLGPEGLAVTKEVGFFFAPNWLLTGLILLPLALLYLFRTRAAIEPLISKLVQRGMLVHLDGTRARETEVMALWMRHSRWWSNVATGIFIAAIAFTVVADFIPVVLNWNLADPATLASFLNEQKVTLAHPTYEFDWSVASTFADATIPGWANALFAFFAYLFIPLIGSATMFAAMVWLFATHGVFNANSLAAEGYKLLPDLAGSDERCGFELFEEFFDNLVRATFVTALIVVGMHLQNVYLRAPEFASITDMVFGDDLTTLMENIITGNFAEILSGGLGLRDAGRTLGASASEFSPQTYVAVVALLMLAVILFGMVWGWLRTSAMRGQDELILALADERYREQRERLEDMKVWPIGWAGINIVITSVVIVAGSMVWTNFLYLVIAYLVAAAVARMVSFVKSAVVDGMRRNQRRRREVVSSRGGGVVLPPTLPDNGSSIVETRMRDTASGQVEQKLLIPSAELLKAQIEAVPLGSTRDLGHIRDDMARLYNADAACPVTTQRLLKAIATQAVADHQAGRVAIPFWRVVDPDKAGTDRLAGGKSFVKARLAQERR